MLSGRMWAGLARQQGAQDARTHRWGFQESTLTTMSVAIESRMLLMDVSCAGRRELLRQGARSCVSFRNFSSQKGVVSTTQGDSATAKRKAEETGRDGCTNQEQIQTVNGPASQVQVGGSSSSGSVAVSPAQTEQRVVVPSRGAAGRVELHRRHADRSAERQWSEKCRLCVLIEDMRELRGQLQTRRPERSERVLRDGRL